MSIRKVFKALWIVITGISTAAVLWFLLGATANFQRPLYFDERLIFVFIWIPTAVFTVQSVRLLRRGWCPPETSTYVMLVLSLTVLYILTVPILYHGVDTAGWLTKRIDADKVSVTEDGKYAYNLELVNYHQRNGYIQVHVRNSSTEQEFCVKVDVSLGKIDGIGSSRNNTWSILEPTEDPDHYILTITEQLNRHVAGEMFDIDMLTRTSQKISEKQEFS